MKQRPWVMGPGILLLVAVASGVLFWFVGGDRMAGPPIRVGVLHSLSGTMAVSETAVVDATLLAVEEINQRGGVLGRRVDPIIVDGRSDRPTFAAQAEALIMEKQVAVVFGCWTSASRKTVKPVFEKHNHLLFYPVQYEGIEESPNIIYTGAAPNQQIIPAVDWCLDNLGKRVFLVASDYVFPHAANAIIKDRIAERGGDVVGEEYVLLGSRAVGDAVRGILESQPDVILNTINGDSNAAFFNRLREAGITPDRIPTMSFSIGEEQLRTMGAKHMAGDYACWNYFQSVDSRANREFVRNFKQKYGDYRVTDDPMEAGHLGVHLWALAVSEAGTTEPSEVRAALRDQAYSAPEGVVIVDIENGHLWKNVRVARIREDGQFDIVWSSGKPVRPEPYPPSRSREEWDQFIQELYDGWGQSWENPGNEKGTGP